MIQGELGEYGSLVLQENRFKTKESDGMIHKQLGMRLSFCFRLPVLASDMATFPQEGQPTRRSEGDSYQEEASFWEQIRALTLQIRHMPERVSGRLPRLF